MQDRCERCVSEVLEGCDQRLETWIKLSEFYATDTADVIEEGILPNGEPADIDGLMESTSHTTDMLFRHWAQGLKREFECGLSSDECLYKWRQKIMELRSQE